MTEREDKVRVSLYGCSHKPKVSAMVSPKRNDDFYCVTCRRKRKVMGVITTWAFAVVQCRNCAFGYENDGKLGRKRITAVALHHANSRIHKVDITHDGIVQTISGNPSAQIPLIDDLLL